MTLEHFELPRDDWYDTVSTDEKTGQIRGRIYKDRLIENFNAIESKLNELTNLQPYNTKYPDTSKFVYSDTTLDSDTNKVVNLKSFIDIMHLKNVPLAVEFDGTILRRLTYYSDEYKPVVIANIQIEDVSTDKPFIVASVGDQTVVATADVTEIADGVILGKYNGETIDSCYSKPVTYLDVEEVQINSSKPITKTISGSGYTYYEGNSNIMAYTKNYSGGVISDYTQAYNKEVEE